MALLEFGDVYFPYCLHRLQDGRYAVLNREYKPVGFYTMDHITYEEHPVVVKLKITKALAKKLSAEEDGNSSPYPVLSATR